MMKKVLKILIWACFVFSLTMPAMAVSPIASPSARLENIPAKDKEKIEELKRKLEEKSKDLRLPAAIVGVLKTVGKTEITVATNKGAETFDIKAAKIIRVAAGKITPLEISDLKKEIESKLLLLGRKDKINNTFMVKVVQVRAMPVNIQGTVTEKAKNALTVTAKNGTKTMVEISSVKDKTEIFTLGKDGKRKVVLEELSLNARVFVKGFSSVKKTDTLTAARIFILPEKTR